MIDMLVRLYDLPEMGELKKELAAQGIVLRRPRAFEKHILADWVRQHFSPKWVSECEVALARQPVACWIATREKEILGFACYDVTARGFLGPMGVGEAARGTGLGKALLVTALNSLHEMGHAYGIIGGVGPREFYAKTVGAVEIAGSDPGFYVDILPDPKRD